MPRESAPGPSPRRRRCNEPWSWTAEERHSPPNPLPISRTTWTSAATSQRPVRRRPRGNVPACEGGPTWHARSAPPPGTWPAWRTSRWCSRRSRWCWPRTPRCSRTCRRPSLAAHPQGAARASAAGRRGAQPEHEEVRFALQGRLLPGSRHREPVARGSARGDRHGPRAARRPVRAGRPWDGWGDRRDPPAVTDNVPGREPAGLSRGTTGLPDARVSPVRAAAARPARRRTNTGAIRVPRRGRR